MFWLLLSLVLLVCLVGLAFCLLTLWRQVKVLGRQVGDVGATVSEAQQAIEDSKAGGPLAVEPCPTCGTPVKAAVLRSAGVRA